LNVQLCSYYIFACIECDLNFISYKLAPESEAARRGTFSWEEMVKASIKIWLVRIGRIGLVISVDWEHGTRIDHIAPAPTTYPVTEVGHTSALAMYKNNECHQSLICVCK
jgi:hypothetical protein